MLQQDRIELDESTTRDYGRDVLISEDGFDGTLIQMFGGAAVKDGYDLILMVVKIKTSPIVRCSG